MMVPRRAVTAVLRAEHQSLRNDSVWRKCLRWRASGYVENSNGWPIVLGREYNIKRQQP